MSGINYSQCWEDAELLKRALQINTDDVVMSITSGGDNSLALLLESPKKLFFVDKNPVQNYLAELKLTALKMLTHKQYLEFLGVHESKSRLKYFEQVSSQLSHSAASWFTQNSEVIEKGIIHEGKFEKYLNKFRKTLLPLVHSRNVVSRFINQNNLQDQIFFYENTWNTWRWRTFFGLASNAFLLKKFARQVGTRKPSEFEDHGYFRRLEHLILRSYLKNNYYMYYSLVGEYGASCPEYLLESSHKAFQSQPQSPSEFCSKDVQSFLRNIADNTLTKFNLSDSFEFLTPYEALCIWKEIVRTAGAGAIVVYWCNRLEHVPPKELEQNLRREKELEMEFVKEDKLYFYRSFHVYTITK